MARELSKIALVWGWRTAQLVARISVGGRVAVVVGVHGIGRHREGRDVDLLDSWRRALTVGIGRTDHRGDLPGLGLAY